jgi:hypothetical protein
VTGAPSRALPSPSISLIAAGVTGSLNRNRTVFGACDIMLPSLGSVETSDACADALLVKQKTDNNIAKSIAKNTAGPWTRRIIRTG